MPGTDTQPVVLGPFLGGLNQADDPHQIADNEMAICQNLDINLRGDLVQRPALRLAFNSSVQSVGGGPSVAAHYLVGTALVDPNNSRLYIYSELDGNLYYQDGPSLSSTPYNKQNSWVPASQGAPGKMVQYNNYAWFIPRDTLWNVGGFGSQGFKSNTQTGAGNVGAYVPAMPRGSGGVIAKDRLFIFGPTESTAFFPSSRVYYSAATNFDSWPGANFFDVNPGDGQGVTAMYALQDSVLIFKRHSIYVLTFDSDPGLGTLRKIHDSIGCTGPDAVTMMDGAVYFAEDQSVYRIVNYNVSEIGRNLGLRSRRATVSFGARTQDFVYGQGNKILFALYMGASYSYYVYHTEINAWTEYVYTEQPERFFRVISATHIEDMYASKYGTYKIYQSQPFGYNEFSGALLGDYPTSLLPIKIRTKTFNFGDYTSFKRIFYWGAEMLVNQSMGPVASAVKLTAWHDDGGFVGRAVKDYPYGTAFATAFFKAPAPKRARWMHFQIDTVSNTAVNPFFRFFLISLFVKGKARVDASVT